MDKLYVYCANSYIGQLIKDNDKFRFIIENSDDYFSNKGIAENALDKRCNDSDFLYDIMVCDRICPLNRLSIREILDRHGIAEYDPWELLKAAHGINVLDLIWMHTEKVDPDWFFENHAEGIRLAKKNKKS